MLKLRESFCCESYEFYRANIRVHLCDSWLDYPSGFDHRIKGPDPIPFLNSGEFYSCEKRAPTFQDQRVSGGLLGVVYQKFAKEHKSVALRGSTGEEKGCQTLR